MRLLDVVQPCPHYSPGFCRSKGVWVEWGQLFLTAMDQDPQRYFDTHFLVTQVACGNAGSKATLNVDSSYDSIAHVHLQLSVISG